MGERSKGKKSNTRSIFRKRNSKSKGLTQFFLKFEKNEKVIINIDSSVQSGQPHRRFQGRHGKIIKIQGSCYLVHVPVYSKTALCAIEHLRKVK